MADGPSISDRSVVPRLTVGALTVLFLPLFTVGLGYGAVLPILPGLLARLHGTTSAASHGGILALHAGLLTGVYIGAFVIAAPLWGRLTDRYGARWVMAVDLLGYAAATVWFGATASLTIAYAARFIAGAFAAGLAPATSTWIAGHCRGEERIRLLGWVSAASALGFLVGPALAGWVHDALSRAPVRRFDGSLHLTAVPIWTTAAMAALAAVCLSVSRRLGEPASGDQRGAARSPAPRTPGRLDAVLALSLLGALGIGALEVGLTLENARLWRFSTSELGVLFVACSLVMLVVQFTAYAPLRRRLGPRALLTAGFVTMAAGFLVLSDTLHYAAVVALVGLVALGSSVLQPTLSVAAADRAGREVGSAVGYQTAAAGLGQAAGSAGVGVLFGALPPFSFAVIAAVMTASAAIAAWRGATVPPAVASSD